MDPFKNRRWVIILIIISVGIIFSFRLLYIQIINNEWSERAEKISLSSENLQPPRGFIYDRNNKATMVFIKDLRNKEKKF